MCRVCFRLLPEGITKDYWHLKYVFWKRFGRNLPLGNPQTFTEKIQWLKLYDRNPSHTLKADKYSVRDFVKNTIGEQHLVKLYGVWDRAEDIDFDALPDRFVLKANHGCGWNIICSDKSQLDRKETVKKLNEWLNINYYDLSGSAEWVYKNIQPRIICEEFLEANTEWGLLDYKIFCFNGQPTLVKVVFDRFGEGTVNIYDTLWNRLPVTYMYPPNMADAPPPPCLKEMLQLASSLAKDIPFVRVDFYDHNGKIIFGEMTFYPCSGLVPWEPIEFDHELGKLLKLPSMPSDGVKNTSV